MTWAALRTEIGTVPPGRFLTLRNPRAPQVVLPEVLGHPVADGLSAVGIHVAGGAVVQINAAGQGGTDAIGMGQRIARPAAVDCRTHIDKGRVWTRSANPEGPCTGVNTVAGADGDPVSVRRFAKATGKAGRQ